MPIPLPRPGDAVWIRRARWRVERSHATGDTGRLDVTRGHDRRTFLTPFDRVSPEAPARRLAAIRPRQACARLAHLHAHSGGGRGVLPALEADVAILPHQLEVPLAFSRGARRILLADEVGLGKTIQAGLVVAALLQQQPLAHILLVVPGSLGDQWRDELARRFRIPSYRADIVSLGRLSRDAARGRSPWTRPGVFITSPDFIKQEHIAASLPVQLWDLVAIDEAHTVSGDSDRHHICRVLTERARRVLLLTATPHDGDETAFERLRALGRVAGLDDELLMFRRTRADTGLSNDRRARWRRVEPAPAELRLLNALLAFERDVLRRTGDSTRDAAVLFLSVLRKRALSAPAALRLSIDRRLLWLAAAETGGSTPDWMQPRLIFEDESDALSSEERSAFSADIGLSAGQEQRWLIRMQGLSSAAESSHAKTRYLRRVLQRCREPAVVFTEYKDTLDVLTIALGRYLPGSIAVVYGSQSPAERRRELDGFLSGHANVLLATDVAGQGLNLQARARWVVNFEMPWNPIRLEQRAGRVDRIGQTRTVHITSLLVAHPAESSVLGALGRRTLAARRALGSSVFDATMPGEAALRSIIIGESPFPADTTSPPAAATVEAALCRAWMRTARAEARHLQQRRAFAARWRGPGTWSNRPGGTILKKPRRSSGTTSSSVLVCTASIVDQLNVIVERRTVAVRLPGAASTWLARPAVDALCSFVERRIAARVRRLQHEARRQSTRDADRERALLALLALQSGGGPRQPAFLGPTVPNWHRDELQDQAPAGNGPISPASEPRVLHVGPVSISLVFQWRASSTASTT